MFLKDVLDLQRSGQMWKGSENAKNTKRLNHEEVKKQLIESMANKDVMETQELNKKAEEVDKPEDAAAVIKQYEDIIRTKKKGIVSIAYHQRKVFKKFKDNKKFVKLVNKFKVHKTTIIFKINIYKLIEKYSKLIQSLKKFLMKMQRSFHKYLLSF